MTAAPGPAPGDGPAAGDGRASGDGQVAGHRPGTTRRTGRTRERGAMVPPAEFTSYYGRPILKRPTWKSPDVPLYLWSGGAAGTAAGLAALADLTARPTLRRAGRITAAAGVLLGTGALIHDLGRPARFLYMLRVIKPTSPLSVGTWILSPFGGLATAAAASELTGIAPRLGRLAGWGSAALGPALASYTGVLIADTAVPVWHEARGELPVLFAGSAAAAGGGAGLVAAAVRDNHPAARIGAVGAVTELATDWAMRRGLARLPGGIEQVYHRGRARRWHRAARALTAGGALGAVLLRRSRTGAVASGLALLAGSLATRFAVFEAGRASAEDPRHVVAPQRDRLDQAVESLA